MDMSLTGYTAASWDTSAATSFKSAVAEEVLCHPNAITIISVEDDAVTRRDGRVKVKFQIETSSADTAASISTSLSSIQPTAFTATLQRNGLSKASVAQLSTPTQAAVTGTQGNSGDSVAFPVPLPAIAGAGVAFLCLLGCCCMLCRGDLESRPSMVAPHKSARETITSAIDDLTSADKSLRQAAADTLTTCYREQLTPYLETLIRAVRKSEDSDVLSFVGQVFTNLPWDQRQTLADKHLCPINDLDLRIGTLMLLQELPAVERDQSKMDTHSFLMMAHTESPWHEQEGFKQCLTDPNPEVKHRSLDLQVKIEVSTRALSRSQIQGDEPDCVSVVMDRKSINRAIQEVGSADKSVRQAATRTLKECSMDDLDPYLKEEIKFKICMAEWRDPKEEVMQSATTWQRAIRTTMLQQRFTGLFSTNVPDETEAVLAIEPAVVMDRDNINKMISELASSSEFQRQVATRGLKKCNPEQLTPYLETMIRAARNSEDSDVLSFVGEVFISLPSQQSHSGLSSLLDAKNDKALRVGTLMMLEELEQDSKPVLLQHVAFTRCLTDDDSEVKRRALILERQVYVQLSQQQAAAAVAVSAATLTTAVPKPGAAPPGHLPPLSLPPLSLTSTNKRPKLEERRKARLADLEHARHVAQADAVAMELKATDTLDSEANPSWSSAAQKIELLDHWIDTAKIAADEREAKIEAAAAKKREKMQVRLQARI